MAKKFADIEPNTYDRSEEGRRHKAMIGSTAWRRYSRKYLEQHPLCECPHHRGKDARFPSQLVDHRKPPKGDRKLFWNPDNHVAMHRSCHSGPKQSEERGGHGFLRGSDERGWPLSFQHHWFSKAE